jgi:hypothetical protein
MYILINEEGKLEIYAEEEDICYACSNMNRCPLMASLYNELVVLRYEGLDIEECGMFEEISVSELINDISS